MKVKSGLAMGLTVLAAACGLGAISGSGHVTTDRRTVSGGTRIRPSREIVYRVSAKSLNGITLSGSGTVDATGINADSLKMMLNGSGRISASGRADQQEIDLNGSGDFQGANLKGKTVSVSIAGSGDGVVAASETLDVTVMGSGSIEYIGDPKVTQTSLGSGSVKKR